jgi:hypothetical protein
MKSRVIRIIATFLLIFSSVGCNWFNNEEEIIELRNDLSRRVDNNFLDDFKTTYVVGDVLPSTFGEVQIEWILNTSTYFDNETLVCLGSDGSDKEMTITARFVESEDVFVEKSITITILDNFVRNNEEGIVDEALYDYVLLIVDLDNDNKISITEALAGSLYQSLRSDCLAFSILLVQDINPNTTAIKKQ